MTYGRADTVGIDSPFSNSHIYDRQVDFMLSGCAKGSRYEFDRSNVTILMGCHLYSVCALVYPMGGTWKPLQGKLPVLQVAMDK